MAGFPRFPVREDEWTEPRSVSLESSDFPASIANPDDSESPIVNSSVLDECVALILAGNTKITELYERLDEKDKEMEALRQRQSNQITTSGDFFRDSLAATPTLWELASMQMAMPTLSYSRSLRVALGSLVSTLLTFSDVTLSFVFNEGFPCYYVVGTGCGQFAVPMYESMSLEYDSSVEEIQPDRFVELVDLGLYKPEEIWVHFDNEGSRFPVVLLPLIHETITVHVKGGSPASFPMEYQSQCLFEDVEANPLEGVTFIISDA